MTESDHGPFEGWRIFSSVWRRQENCEEPRMRQPLTICPIYSKYMRTHAAVTTCIKQFNISGDVSYEPAPNEGRKIPLWASAPIRN
jgi:hypothetical protein